MKLVYVGVLCSFIAMNVMCMEDNFLDNNHINNSSSPIHHSPEKKSNYEKHQRNHRYKEQQRKKRSEARQCAKQTLKK